MSTHESKAAKESLGRAKSLPMKCFGFVCLTQSSDIYLLCQDAKMAFTNMLGHSQEPTIYSSKELCSNQNLTSDVSGLLKNPLMKAELYQVPIFIPPIYFHNFTHTVVLRGLLKTCVHCCAVAITKKKKDCEAISLFRKC